jgi:hypothetical protein
VRENIGAKLQAEQAEANKLIGQAHGFKRGVIAVVGGTVLALGIALIMLPGPAFLVIPGGLAILAIEFAWGFPRAA